MQPPGNRPRGAARSRAAVTVLVSRLLAAWIAFGLVVSCGDDPKKACTPGTTQECTGAGRCAGAQACNAQGTGYGDCVCGSGDAGPSSGGSAGQNAGGAGTGGASAGGAAAGGTAAGGTAAGGVAAGGAGAGGAPAQDASVDQDAGQDSASPEGGATCSVVAGTGCSPGERCSWLEIESDVWTAACGPDGAQGLMDPCSYGAAGPTTGFDDCSSPLVCAGGHCIVPCEPGAGGCAGGFTCKAFVRGGGTQLGACVPTCNPLTQRRTFDGAAACGSATPATPELGCFGEPGGDFTCVPTVSLTHTHRSVPPAVFPNICAPGYLPLLRRSSSDATPVCIALCAPAETHSSATAQAGGVSPYTCAQKGATGPTEECRFLSALADTPTALDRTLGYCFDYALYTYDPGGGAVPQPSCTALSSSDTDFNGLADHLEWGCAPAP